MDEGDGYSASMEAAQVYLERGFVDDATDLFVRAIELAGNDAQLEAAQRQLQLCVRPSTRRRYFGTAANPEYIVVLTPDQARAVRGLVLSIIERLRTGEHERFGRITRLLRDAQGGLLHDYNEHWLTMACRGRAELLYGDRAAGKATLANAYRALRDAPAPNHAYIFDVVVWIMRAQSRQADRLAMLPEALRRAHFSAQPGSFKEVVTTAIGRNTFRDPLTRLVES